MEDLWKWHLDSELVPCPPEGHGMLYPADGSEERSGTWRGRRGFRAGTHGMAST